MTRNEMPRRALLQAAAALGIAGAAKAQPSPCPSRMASGPWHVIRRSVR